MTEQNTDMAVISGKVAAAYFSRNQVQISKVSEVIHEIYDALTNLGSRATVAETETGIELGTDPAVPIDQSVTDNAIICLEDGKPYKTLKRHLRTAYDMSPDEYRERWGLSKDYPMTAPAYSRKRSQTAKDIGLGTKRAA